MPKFDLNITCAVILSFCALISPSITAIINNRHQYRIKQLELEHEGKKHRYELLYQQKLNIFRQFVNESSSCDWLENDSDYMRINALLRQAMLLCDSDTLPLLIKLQAYVNGNCYSKTTFNELLTSISESFNKELTDLLPRKAQ